MFGVGNKRVIHIFKPCVLSNGLCFKGWRSSGDTYAQGKDSKVAESGFIFFERSVVLKLLSAVAKLLTYAARFRFGLYASPEGVQQTAVILDWKRSQISLELPNAATFPSLGFRSAEPSDHVAGPAPGEAATLWQQPINRAAGLSRKSERPEGNTILAEFGGSLECVVLRSEALYLVLHRRDAVREFYNRQLCMPYRSRRLLSIRHKRRT